MQTHKPTSGWMSSEFWLTLLTNLMGGAIQFDVFPRESIALKVAGMAAMVLATMNYSVARARLKAAHIQKPSTATATATVTSTPTSETEV